MDYKFEQTAEQQRAAELKAQGLRRSSWDGRVEPIPTELTPAADFVKALDAQVKAGTLSYENRQRALGVETMRLHAKRIEDIHAAGVAQAAANRAEREAQEAAQRAELHNLWAESEAQKQAAWTRYVTLAGKTADGGLVADKATFDREWQMHLAQRAITESVA